MSQSRQSTASARLDASPDTETLAETYAEDLMDEIFDDVDRILAGDEQAIYAEIPAPEVSNPSLFQAEAVTVPAMIVPFSADQTVQANMPMGEPPPVEDAVPAKAPDKPEKKSPRWRRILLGTVCLSSLVALGGWWVRQNPSLLGPALTTVPSAVPAPAAPTVSKEVAFGDYLKRSLRIIGGERTAQMETQQNPAVVATVPTPTNQPTGRSGVIERVFVPLLQPGNRTVTTTTLPTPTVAGQSQDATTNNTQNNNTTAAAPNNSTTPAPGTAVPNIAAASTYELLGVLELGNRSAALFEVNGTSQRVYIGETIGSSGWSIVSIENEEVVVRRNGEVRSIYIGQQF